MDKWCGGPITAVPTVRSLLDVTRCHKCAHLSQLAWRSLATPAASSLGTGEAPATWGHLIPGEYARMYTMRDNYNMIKRLVNDR